MSLNMNEMNYVLDEMNVNLYNRNDVNKLVIAVDENLNHFCSKALMFYILSDLNHDMICNHYIIGVGNIDIYDVSARVLYILDSYHSEDYQNMIDELYPYSHLDVVAINIEELPDDIFQRYLKLRECIMLG